MLKEFIEKIIDLKKPEQIDVDGKIYYDKNYHPVYEEFPNHLGINNLTGIVDFIKENPEKWKNLFVHIEDFNCVNLYKGLSGGFNQRTLVLVGKSRDCKFNFGNYLSIENFIISLNSMFIPTKDRDHILQFISGIRVDSTAKLEDDGVTQTITAKKGASSLLSDMPVKNIVELIPFRSFNEIDQPVSEFVFRLKLDHETPYCALFECDGEAWKQSVIQSIGKYFWGQEIGIPVIA